MFEKMKEKAKKGKQWVIDHKTGIAYFVGATVGIVVTTAIFMYDDSKAAENKKRVTQSNRKKYSREIGVLDMRDEADGLYWLHGEGGPIISDLSNTMIGVGTPENARVIGALVYTKE